jgi:hypothetical protein
MESGWLKKGIYARGTNNPFGQTGVGSAGFVVGADGQKHKAYGTLDEAVQDHLKRWGKYYQGDAQQTLGNLVKGGYNTVNGNWAPSILSTYNKQAGQPQLPQTQTPYPIQNLGQSDSTSEKKLMFSEPRIEKQAQNLSPETTQAANRLRQLQEYTITSTTGGQHAAGSQHYAHNNPEGTGGRAIDIRIRDMNTQQRQQLLENARRAGFNRIGISGDHLHADLGPGPFKVFDEGGGARAFGISAGEAQKRLSGIEVGVPSQQQAGPPGAQKQDNRMAFSFSTEKPLDVAETIKKSGLKPGQNIIGVDVQQDERGQYKSPEHLKTMQEAEKAGAKVHLYHQGPGMKEFGESSKGWEENLKQMLSKNRNAYSYEVDNLDQFGTPDKQLQFIRSLHEWQKQNNLSQKITLKNANVDLMKKIGETKDLDRNLFSQFQIQEQNTGRGTGGESAQEVAKRNEAGKQLNLTPVVTGNTNQYEQRNPVIAEGGGQQPSGEVRQPPVPNTAQGLTPPAPQNQKAPEEQKSEPPPTHEHGSSSNDYERASRQSSAPQNSMGAAGASINPLAQTPGSHFALYGGGIMV